MTTDSETDKPTLGHAIRAERRRRRLTQTELARRLGVSYRQVLRYERGDARDPQPELARALKKVLGIDIEKYEPEPPAEETLRQEVDRQRKEIRRLRSDLSTLSEIVSDLRRRERTSTTS